MVNDNYTEQDKRQMRDCVRLASQRGYLILAINETSFQLLYNNQVKHIFNGVAQLYNFLTNI